MANKGGGFAILVTGFSHITKTGIKTKLVAYFQSKKKSGGGECDVEIFENGNAVVTFQKRDAQKSVLERTHAITFDGQNIQLSVTQYSGELKNSQQDDHEVCSPVKNNSPCAPEVTAPPRIAQNESIEQNTLNDSPRICIKLKTEQFDHDHFSLFIECCSGTNSFQVLHTNETSVYIVEFMHDIDLNKALHTLNNKTFCGLQLVAKHLPRTQSLHVTQLPELIREDFLALYFERFVKHDGYVELQMDESTQSAIIIFPNPEVIEDILSKTHTIRGHTLKLHRYYKSENLTEFTTEQEREDSNPSNKDKEDLDSLTQKNEDDETKLASIFETEECQFKNKYHVLILKNQHLDKEFPHVQLHFDTSQNVVKITGMENEILKVQLKLLNKENQITSKIIPLSRHLRVFLTQLNANGFLTQMFLDSGINAAYSFDDAEDKCILYAASEAGLQKADQMLEMTFVELTVPIPENFDMDIANNFKFFIEKATASVKREHLEFKNIKENYLLQHHMESKTSSDQSPCVTLVGYRAIAEEIKVHFKKYMNENCMKDCFIEVSSLGVFKYIQRFVKFSEILPGINIDYVNNEQLLGLQIRVNVKNATQTEALIMDVLKQVKSTKKQLDKPGAVQFFSKNKDFLKKLENPYQCIIFMENQEGQQTNSDIKKLETITTVMFLNKFQISVIKHDLAIHEVDVILLWTNEMLDFSTGLSKALLEAGGPEFQDQVDRLRNKLHAMKDGAVITTGSGKLQCSIVLHAKWTKFVSLGAQEETAFKKTILSALCQANDQLHTSIAISVLSSGESPFLWITVKAIKEYCEKFKKADAQLTDIRLVSTDDASIKSMKKIVKEVIDPESKHSKMPAVMKLAFKRDKKSSSASAGLELQEETIKMHPISKMKPDTTIPETQPAKSDDTFVTVEGLEVVLITGNIGEQKCDVIVNTVSDTMDLSQGPVSKAILKQAGPQLQINTNNAKGSTTFQAGDVLPVSTMNCGLHCQEVYNIICCQWSADKAFEAEELLRSIIQKCLKNAHESHYKSMSFPAIGTGNLKFPKNTVAEMFFEEIKKFSVENPTSTLKRVKLIIYEKDLDLYSIFEDALMIAEGLPLNELLFYKELRKAQKVPDSPPANMTREVETVSSLLLMNIGKITFELRCDGISKNGNVLVVDYGEKKTDFDTIARGRVYYIKPRGQADFTKNLLKALQMCGNHQYDFLYIPIPKQQGSDFSTGSPSRDIRGFAASVIDSIYQYGDTPQATPIHVIVNDSSSDHARVFQEVLSKHQAGKSGIFNTVTKYFGGWLTGNQTEDARDIQEHSVQPVKFQIYSMKEENIEEAWADIQKLATREHMEKIIPVEISFEMFTQEDYDEIEECCSKMHVAYQLDRAGRSIFLSGCITDICSVQDVIFKVCHNIAKREVTLQEELFIMDKVCWKFWLDDHWETFNPTVNACLEKAYNEKENEVQVKIGGGDFCVIDFQKWTLTDSNATSYSIDRRCSGDELPDTWEIRGNDSTSFEVPVKPDSSEYQEIARDFQDSLGDIASSQTFKIDAITRIQNLSLWRLYIAKRNEMNRLRPHQQNENILYHGTYSTVCSKINADGFNRSYCGLNAVFYGEGTYFAQHARYSAHDTYSKPDATGSKLIYRARVLTGDYCKGKKDMKEPPLKDPQGNNRERYNSVTDKMESPEVFVVFQDNQAYPEYLITFHN